ncbi:MAG: hypothetical protein ACTSR8_06210 [Promethearchaeota archaeon]
MNKPESYLDWQKNFKLKPEKENQLKDTANRKPLGIKNKLFIQYLKRWKKENLKPL